MLYAKFDEMNATSRITNANSIIAASVYIARRAESTHSRAPVRAPYSDAPRP